MSYLGKEYKFEKDENYDEFHEVLKKAGIPVEALPKYTVQKSTTKLDKDGDTYTVTSVNPDRTSVVSFQSGVGVEEELKAGFKIYNTYTVEGNTVTQVLKLKKDDERSLTQKREYDGDKLAITITASFWDGRAKRYYSA